MVGHDDRYDYYRVSKGKNKFKRGTLLVRFPDRPYCQVREWIVRKTGGARPELDYLEEGGRFVRCP